MTTRDLLGKIILDVLETTEVEKDLILGDVWIKLDEGPTIKIPYSLEGTVLVEKLLPMPYP